MVNRELINNIKSGDILVIKSFYKDRTAKEVVIVKEMWMNIETMEIRLKGVTVRDNLEVIFSGQDILSLLKELDEVTEVDLSKDIKSSEIPELFYSWMREINEEHKVEYVRDQLIGFLELAATRRLDEIE